MSAQRTVKYIRKSTAFLGFMEFSDGDLTEEISIHRLLKRLGVEKEKVEGIDASGFEIKKTVFMKFVRHHELETFFGKTKDTMFP
ncbi:hypothetical protein QYM36_001036 [Artemia franciscana]|uniref:Uncharacterized protein n=1 Tax=Artemia franciscana TaxID=6661 RepID=A0AA88IAA7_ARTSF|nr:hypothetical protein QYM36_001036 [Artemia franciscana]